MNALRSYLRRHWVKVSIITLIFVISMGRFQHKMPKRQFADFHVNYFTGQKMLKGENIYDVAAYRKFKVANFKYPPLFATLTALFALTSERIAATAWFTFNYLLIILFMYFSGKMIFAEKLTGKQKNWIYFLALFFTSRFYLQNFDEGQVNFLMMTTILLGLYAEKHNKSFLAGMLLGFSILVKYMGVVFIPYFLIKRRFKVVLFIVLALIIYGLVPALFWGWERNSFLQSQYIPFLCKTSLDMSSLSDYVNQSLMSMLIRLFSSHGNYGINLVSLKDYQLGFLTGCLYVFIYSLTIYPAKCYEKEKNGRQLNNIDLALLFACAALFNPNAWMHAFIFLTFGYMVIFAYLFKTSFQDRYVLTLLLLSFVFHSFTNSTITQYWNRDIFDVFSFVTIGALFALLALLKIKFSPKENYP